MLDCSFAGYGLPGYKYFLLRILKAFRYCLLSSSVSIEKPNTVFIPVPLPPPFLQEF